MQHSFCLQHTISFAFACLFVLFGIANVQASPLQTAPLRVPALEDKTTPFLLRPPQLQLPRRQWRRHGELSVLSQKQSITSDPDLLTASLILLIPTTLAELTIFIGNLIAFTTKKARLLWGIQGAAMSVLGALVSLPWILSGLRNGMAVPFIALHVALLGVSITNIVQYQPPKKTSVLTPWFSIHPTHGAQVGVSYLGQF
ncbi:MAG: hypothetical protein CL920_16360 [Deltaproteobacteria bacterium]|nr:hypothetical protein [Deltaproteobacteria bacterium]